MAQIGLISGNIAGSGCERWPRRPTRPKLSTVVEAAQEQAQADPVRGWLRRRLLGQVFDLGVRRVLLNRRDAILGGGLALVCLADREDLAVARL